MTPELILLAMGLFLVKHFLCDFPIQIQTPWMFLNKGTYGHPGGIVHALIHAVVSLPILVFLACGLPVPLAPMLFVAFLEFLIQYHMDWFKVWWCRDQGYEAKTHPQFWWWLGIDQLVHGLTYVGIIWLFV